MDSFSIRVKKKALLKTAVLEEMLRLLRTKELNEISLEELCHNINTTKVTFFKYFNYKEQVLDYFVGKWLYDRSFEIHLQKFQGEKGLYQVFRSISEDAALGKKIMVSLINYYSKLTEKPAIIEVLPYEYYLFNEEAFQQKVKPLDLCQVFIYYLSGIKSIKPTKYNEVVFQLIALMYGVPIQTHIMELEDMYPFYEIGVKSIIGVKV
jgi:hypothetical protein